MKAITMQPAESFGGAILCCEEFYRLESLREHRRDPLVISCAWTIYDTGEHQNVLQCIEHKVRIRAVEDSALPLHGPYRIRQKDTPLHKPEPTPAAQRGEEESSE